MPQTPKAKLKSLNVPSVQDPSTHKVTYTRWPSVAERWPTPMCRQPICPVLSSLGLGRLVCRKLSANVCSHLALLVLLVVARDHLPVGFYAQSKGARLCSTNNVPTFVSHTYIGVRRNCQTYGHQLLPCYLFADARVG